MFRVWVLFENKFLSFTLILYFVRYIGILHVFIRFFICLFIYNLVFLSFTILYIIYLGSSINYVRPIPSFLFPPFLIRLGFEFYSLILYSTGRTYFIDEPHRFYSAHVAVWHRSFNCIDVKENNTYIHTFGLNDARDFIFGPQLNIEE